MIINKESGLTKIELISLIILFGVLIAISLPEYRSMQTQKAQESLEVAAKNGASTVKMRYSSLLMEKQREIGSQEAIRQIEVPEKDSFSYRLQALDNKTVQLTTQWKAGKKPSGVKDKLSKIIELRK